MKRLILFAAVAGLGSVNAGPPSEAAEERRGYPPCSATVTDECIQLYERGVRTPANLARNDMRHAGGGARRYPPCTATRKDECRQQRALARRVRMAGERG